MHVSENKAKGEWICDTVGYLIAAFAILYTHYAAAAN